MSEGITNTVKENKKVDPKSGDAISLSDSDSSYVI